MIDQGLCLDFRAVLQSLCLRCAAAAIIAADSGWLLAHFVILLLLLVLLKCVSVCLRSQIYKKAFTG